jgi:hypothetical protein
LQPCFHREVEDQLAALRILDEESAIQCGAHQRAEGGIQTRQMNASVLLLKGLGGGWKVTSIAPD